eukprot:2410216-Pyramimonas_sp.AAC.1
MGAGGAASEGVWGALAAEGVTAGVPPALDPDAVVETGEAAPAVTLSRLSTRTVIRKGRSSKV